MHWEPEVEPTTSDWIELQQMLARQAASFMVWEDEPLPATVERLSRMGLEVVAFHTAANRPEMGDFLWDELWTTDVDNASAFYNNVAGLAADTVDIDPEAAIATSYSLLKSGETPRVGIMPNPLDGLDPVWVSYLRVESPAAITARVAELGGRVIIEAGPRAIGGEVAFVAGPSGAGIALQTWPFEQQNQETE